YLAVRTGSIYPAILFHFTHNSLVVLTSRLSPDLLEQYAWLRSVFTVHQDSLLFHAHVAAGTGLLALGVAGWFRRIPLQRSREEELTRALGRQRAAEKSSEQS